MARVILIEDDELIRETTEELVELCGHEVALAAGSAGEALARAAGAAADLALIDYSLPDMDGGEAARRLREVLPGLAVIITSGRRLDPQSLPNTGGPVSFLQKPYDMDALAAVLERAGQ
jgi:CheY-like chemotaxis protein